MGRNCLQYSCSNFVVSLAPGAASGRGQSTVITDIAPYSAASPPGTRLLMPWSSHQGHDASHQVDCQGACVPRSFSRTVLGLCSSVITARAATQPRSAAQTRRTKSPFINAPTRSWPLVAYGRVPREWKESTAGFVTTKGCHTSAVGERDDTPTRLLSFQVRRRTRVSPERRRALAPRSKLRSICAWRSGCGRCESPVAVRVGRQELDSVSSDSRPREDGSTRRGRRGRKGDFRARLLCRRVRGIGCPHHGRCV